MRAALDWGKESKSSRRRRRRRSGSKSGNGSGRGSGGAGSSRPCSASTVATTRLPLRNPFSRHPFWYQSRHLTAKPLKPIAYRTPKPVPYQIDIVREIQSLRA